MRAFSGLRPGRPAGSYSRRSPRRRAGRSCWPRPAGPGGRGPATAAILVYSPASRRGPHHPTGIRLAQAMLGTFHVSTCRNIGLVRSDRSLPGRYLPAGNLSAWMRVCVLEESLVALLVLLARLVCFRIVVRL